MPRRTRNSQAAGLLEEDVIKDESSLHELSLGDAHMMTEAQLLKFLAVDLDQGLTEEEVKKRQEKYGKNEFPQEEGKSLLRMILEQFQDVLVLILIGAALVGLVLAFFEEDEEERITAFVEPFVIVLILVANATVGVLQENSAEKAVEALKAYESPHAAVLRSGKIVSLDATEVVPGDIVEVEVGDLIPADIRLLRLSSSSFEVAQAMLTGENYDVEKVVDPVKRKDAQLQDKNNIIFSGTNVTRGKCRGIVIGTGLATEKGKIRDQIQCAEDRDFPLKKKLDDFGTMLSKAIGVICVLVWAINIGHFSDPAFGSVFKGAIFYFKIAISLAVAAIPEGLPAVVTTCLALGTQRMAAKNAIVTVLPAVETLGCTSVICSDKTGTLTTNKMSVRRFFVLGNDKTIADYAVEGDSYDPYKEDKSPFRISSMNTQEVLKVPASIPVIREMSSVATICNDSSITVDDNGVFDKVGQSTEAALKVLAEKIGLEDESENTNLAKLSKHERSTAISRQLATLYKKDFTLEFGRSRKSMSVVVSSDKGRELFVKGAWDNVLGRCTHVMLSNGKVVKLTKALQRKIEDQVLEYCGGRNCFRCLTLAKLENPAVTAEDIHGMSVDDFINYEQELTFLGCVGILDPPRLEVRDAIKECHEAGIRVIVITGDNKSTASAICRAIGVFEENEDLEGKVVTGQEFKKMNHAEKFEIVRTARLFARVEPIDKKDLVAILHEHNQIVAMTGDGVNDAPALKAADIGIAMGTGTAVAKGAAEMVLADDNFTSIVAAVEEGRNLYNNTKQFIRYLITSNIGEVVGIFIAACSGLPEVLQPVQLLWVNLVTDGLPAVALGFNKGEEGIMKEPPRPHDEPIVTSMTLMRYLLTGTYVGIATVLGMVWWFCFYAEGPKIEFSHLFEWARCTPGNGYDCEIFDSNAPGTVSLSVLVTIEMFCALNSLSEKDSLFSASGNPLSNLYLLAAMSLSFSLHFVILYVPFLANIFQVEPIGWDCWQVVIILSLPVLFLDELVKLYLRRRAPQVNHAASMFDRPRKQE